MVVNVQASNETIDTKAKDDFYDILEKTCARILKTDEKLIMG